MNNRLFSYTLLSVALAYAPETVYAQKQSKGEEFLPFQDFLHKTRTASEVDFTEPAARVKDAASLEEMRRHILSVYSGVEVKHTFVLNSSHFDCIPIEHQPGVKAFGLKSVAPAPPQSLIAKPGGNDGEDRALQASQISEKETDEFGNAIGCEQGTIPMRRITLEEMTRFSTLREYFQKGPGEVGRPSIALPKEAPESPTQGHKYSLMTQEVNNLGGNSNLNLWNPPVYTSWGEVFSLSQEWYAGGSGAALQTAEVGWQNFPAKYGNEESRLFIYWTADDYQQTGCYNLECGAFVQVSNSAPLGGGFAEYSSHGGLQYEISAMFYLYRGNWWLAIQGTWIGYYPGAIYRGGQLSRYAQSIEFGTEGVGSAVWPAEGSGYWSTSGFGSSAYQRNLFYFDLSGRKIWDSLHSFDPSPACYNTSGPSFSNSSSWGVNFYEGGPGGPGC